MAFSPLEVEAIRRSKESVTWFLRNFGKLKHPSAGILPFYPFSYQRRALRDFRKHRLNIFRKCFVEGSMVWTPSGPTPIEQLKAGDLVYSYNEKLGSIEIDEVVDSWCNGVKDTVEVRSKTGHRSYCTNDHLFHTNNGWIKSGELTPNDVLTEVYDSPRYHNADVSEAILLGYLLTDGCYSDSGSGRQFHFTNTSWKYLLEYQKHFEKFFDKRLSIKLHAKAGVGKCKKDSYRILSSHAPAKQWLVKCGIWGNKANTKKLPKKVFEWNNEAIAVLLNRMMAGDGWYSGDHCDEVGIGSESEILLHQIKQLLTRFHINSKFYPKSESSLAKLRIFGGDDFEKFVKNIGIYGKVRRCDPQTRGFFFNRKKGQIKSVTPSVKNKVYDLTIKKNSNFVVDGAVAHNCRQAGISKISGAFAIWFAMFHSHKTILIVSRTNDDAMGFLRENIVFLYDHLPPWMKEAWKPVKLNEHEIIFPNGSKIKSLTSHPDVLRSNASSLNIIDEAAFIQGMDVMWAGGWPTLQHGGSVIVISTTNGVGNWYWSTATDAEAGVNQFNPCIVNWYDMDWVIEFQDPLSLQWRRIAPRDGIRECRTTDEIDKYGPYWSPWLEEQYRALQEQGEAWKFEQEILGSFVGSGNTVLPKSVLNHVQTSVAEPEDIIGEDGKAGKKITGYQTYVHPVTGEVEDMSFDFKEPEEGLWIWKNPVLAKPMKKSGSTVIDQGDAAHSYVMGVDIATGKGRDYSAIEIFDIDTMEQVAEFMARCLPRELVKYIDRIGRYYNCALAVVERNNGGDILIDQLRYDMMYPRLWRQKDINDKPKPSRSSTRQRPMQVKPYGWNTTVASKPTLNKFLLDFIRDTDDEGYRIYSKRLLKQLQTYVRKRDRLGHDTTKTEAEEGAGNFDDLVMACAMALRATTDAFIIDSSNLIPMGANSDFGSQDGPIIMSDSQRAESQKRYIDQGGPSLLMPVSMSPDEIPELSAARELDAYTIQLGGIPISQGKPLVTPPKYFFGRDR